MRQPTLALTAAVAGVLLTPSSSGASAAAAQVPDGAHFAQPVMGGSGCRDGARAELAADRRHVTFTFTHMRVRLDGSVHDASRRCVISLTPRAPGRWTYAPAGFAATGSAAVQPGTTGELYAFAYVGDGVATGKALFRSMDSGSWARPVSYHRSVSAGCDDYAGMTLSLNLSALTRESYSDGQSRRAPRREPGDTLALETVRVSVSDFTWKRC